MSIIIVSIEIKFSFQYRTSSSSCAFLIKEIASLYRRSNSEALSFGS